MIFDDDFEIIDFRDGSVFMFHVDELICVQTNQSFPAIFQLFISERGERLGGFVTVKLFENIGRFIWHEETLFCW